MVDDDAYCVEVLTQIKLMSLAGLIVEGIFWIFDAVPTNRPEASRGHFSWNYTTFLNTVSLGNATAHIHHDGRDIDFCSDHCMDGYILSRQ